MKASILTIGDEILNGTTVDTNSAFIAQSAADVGIKVTSIFSFSDTYEGIFSGLSLAEKENDIIFITGGLGPTKDDITKKALADYFNDKLLFNEDVFKTIRAYFERRGKVQVELNKKLAYIPESCKLIENKKGTAFGMWFEKKGKVYISMPGVPYEMKEMLSNGVLPKLVEKKDLPKLIDKYIMTAGIGESAIYEKISDIEEQLPDGISLAYLPKMGSVRLRLSGISSGKNTIEKELFHFQQLIKNRIDKFVYSEKKEDSLEEVIGQLLIERKESVSTAESCTGGYIAHKITSIAGSSAYYNGSIIAYSNAVKENELGVKNETLTKWGAVSEEVVKEMAFGVVNKLQTTYGIAVSGVAGPDGGSDEKPVGTVWLAIAKNDGSMFTKKLSLTKNRGINIRLTSVIALSYLRGMVLEK